MMDNEQIRREIINYRLDKALLSEYLDSYDSVKQHGSRVRKALMKLKNVLDNIEPVIDELDEATWNEDLNAAMVRKFGISLEDCCAKIIRDLSSDDDDEN